MHLILGAETEVQGREAISRRVAAGGAASQAPAPPDRLALPWSTPALSSQEPLADFTAS